MLNRFISVAAVLAFLIPPAAFGQAPDADRLFDQGQFESARKAYAGSTAPAAQVGLVRTLLRLDRWEEAVTAAQAFTVNAPSSADAHGLLALCLIRAGWQPPYAAEAAKSLTLDPQNYWGLVATGRAADWDGHTAEARGLFHKAAALHPEWPDAWADLFVADDDDEHTKEQLATARSYTALFPKGHPHDETAEDARELLSLATAYQTAFETDTPYQHSSAAGDSTAPDSTLKSGSSIVEFLGDYAVFPVTVNGAPFRLLFDTGGGGDVLLNWSAAKRLHLPVIAHSYVRGVSGKEKSDILKAQTMTLAGLDYKSIKIVTADALGDIGDGIIGGDILRDSVVTLDFGKRSATFAQGVLAQAPPVLSGDGIVTLPFRFYHGDLYIPVSLNTVPVWALVDTGASDTTLSLRFAKQQLKTLPKEDVHAGTYGGRHGVGNTAKKMEYIASRDESQITLSETPPVSIAMPTIGTSDADTEISSSAQCDFEISLWLGISSLTYARRVTFDYPRRLMTFEYQIPPPDPPKTVKKK